MPLSDYKEPLLNNRRADGSELTCPQKAARLGCIGGCGCCGITFVLAWIIQFICYWWATIGCSAGALANYDWGAGDVNFDGELGHAMTNMAPRISHLSEKTPSWGSRGFDVIPTNEAGATIGAPVGVFWEYWGPWFNTYVFVDNFRSQPYYYMRRNLLRIGASHKIVRCDGRTSADNAKNNCTAQQKNVGGDQLEVCKDSHETFVETVSISEGSNWLTNKIRKLFGANQGSTYKIYLDDKLAASSEALHTDTLSLAFYNNPGPGEKTSKVASSAIQGRDYHGKGLDEWLVKNEVHNNLPHYVAVSTTALYGFVAAEKKHPNAVIEDPHPSSWLAAVPPALEDPRPSSDESIEIVPSDAQEETHAEVTKPTII